ncbi:hypothetical protein BD414DRAFT_455577 [Trametes punicea]|nr:hypothetical protein BD414DRAFT_455577 [Trametes punicea]
MPQLAEPTREEILRAARKAIRVFADFGLQCCLFGSTACNLFGVSRTPNDVDIVIFTYDYNQEELKELLVQEDSDFYLVRSRNPTADYRILWCRLPTARCKVDILLPGVLNIPNVPRRRVRWISGLPVMPIIPLLLLKLQGWSDHRYSERRDMQEKQYVDVDDIIDLLLIAIDRGQSIWQQNLRWMPRDFVDDAQEHVYDFIAEYPYSDQQWEAVDFAI